MAQFIHNLRSLSHFKLNTLANYAGKFWSNLLSLLLVPVYLHYLGVEAYGLIGAFYGVTSFIGLLDLGLSATVSREVAVRQAVPEKQATIPDLLRTTEVIYWGVSIVIILIMAFLAEPIATQWIKVEKLDLNTVKYTVNRREHPVPNKQPSKIAVTSSNGTFAQVILISAPVEAISISNVSLLPPRERQ